MKQSSLAFGQRKSHNKIRECAGHADLNEIRTCKICFTINELKKKCASIRNVQTGEPLGQWGTKEQLLQRLLKNIRKKQCMSKVSGGNENNTFSVGAGKSIILSFFCFIFWFYRIICLLWIPLMWSLCFETADTQCANKPVVSITTSRFKKAWVAKGRLQFSRKNEKYLRKFNIRYPHHRKVCMSVFFLYNIFVMTSISLSVTGICLWAGSPKIS